MRPGKSRKESQKRRDFFSNFCKLVCPDYSDKKSENTLVRIADTLENVHGILEILQSQAQEFRQKFPGAVTVKTEMPMEPKLGKNQDVHRYKREAIQLLKKATGIDLPMSYEIPTGFYKSIVDHCIRNE